MKKIQILTFLTLSLFCNITIWADIDYSEKIEFSGAFEKIKVSNEGILLGENASGIAPSYFNGIWHSQKLDLKFVKKVLQNQLTSLFKEGRWLKRRGTCVSLLL